MTPYFSIITVSFNAENTIRKTIDSVLKQDFSDYELIIQDGMSKDRTISLIPNDDRIKIYCEKDSGIYDAMNKALKKATGRYLIFLNCGDLLYSSSVLSEISKMTKDIDAPSFIYGNYFCKDMIFEQPKDLSEAYLYRRVICHQSMIIARELFELLGEYDCSYRYMADHDFLMRCFRSNISFVHIPLVICSYLGDGVSESKDGMKAMIGERRRILLKNYSLPKRIKYELFSVITLRRFRMWLFSGHAPKKFTAFYRKFANLFNR